VSYYTREVFERFFLGGKMSFRLCLHHNDHIIESSQNPFNGWESWFKLVKHSLFFVDGVFFLSQRNV